MCWTLKQTYLKCQVCVFEGMKSKQVSESVLFAKVRRWCVLSCYRTAASGQPVTVKAPAADGEAERFPRQLRLVDVSEAEVEMSDSGLICERLWETVARRHQLGWPHWSQSSRCQLLALCTPNKPYRYKPLFSLILVGHQGLQDRKPTTIIISPQFSNFISVLFGHPSC